MFKGIKDRWIRATELADAARKTGKRGWTPEFGGGEFLRGLLGRELDQTDAADRNFQKNLATEIMRDVDPKNQSIFERDFEVAAQQEAEQKAIEIEAAAQAEAQAKAAWLHKTRNSPAARSGAFTDDQRWKQQLKHRIWQADNNRGPYRVKDDPNTPNNEAKEAARAQRFKRRNERLIEKGLKPINPR